MAERAGDPIARLASATVGLEAVAWANSALAMWGLATFPTIPVVATSTQLRDPRGVEVRAVAALESLPITEHRGLALASLELSVASMADELTERSLQDLIDQVIRDRRTTWEHLEPVIHQFRRRGRAGSAMLGRIALERSGEGLVPLSIWSRDVKRLLVDNGFEIPVMEHRVCSAAGALVAQVDLAYPDAEYAIELDSVAFHLNREAFLEDRRRDSALARAGWLSRRFTWAQFHEEPDLLLATVRADLASRQHLAR